MDNKLTAFVGSIQKFSTEDGPGVRSTVFLKGCPLNCAWCHNPEMISPLQQMIISPGKCIACRACVSACPNGGIKVGSEGPEIDWSLCVACGECAKECYASAIRPVAKEMSVQEVLDTVLQDREFYANTGGGVTISGGELLMHREFVKALIDACASYDIHVCLDTSGYAQYEVIEELAACENVDYLLYDMKHIDNAEHLKYTGVGNSQIIDNLRKLVANNRFREKIWMRMPLISGVNDGMNLIMRTRDLYCELGIGKVSLIGYHDFGNSKGAHVGRFLKSFASPSDEKMDEIMETFREAGIATEITGREETIA